MSLYKSNPPLAREKLRERDGDDCWLCEKPIDFTLPPQHPEGPTFEHAIPKALGGTSRWDNLRLSHKRCNHERGSGSVDNRLLFESWSAARL